MPVGRPRKINKAQPCDRLKCEICGLLYNRSGRTLHYRTRIHQVYEQMKNTEDKKIPDNIKNYIIDMYGEVFLNSRDVKYLNNPKVSYNKKISYIDNIVNGS